MHIYYRCSPRAKGDAGAHAAGAGGLLLPAAARLPERPAGAGDGLQGFFKDACFAFLRIVLRFFERFMVQVYFKQYPWNPLGVLGRRIRRRRRCAKCGPQIARRHETSTWCSLNIRRRTHEHGYS